MKKCTLGYVMRHGRRIEVETLELGVAPSKTRSREPDLFIKVPLQWAAAAATATKTPKALVWLLLLHMSWRAKSRTFSFSNEMPRRYGVSRKTKYRVLAALEATGQIRVEQQDGRAPIVTLIGV